MIDAAGLTVKTILAPFIFTLARACHNGAYAPAICSPNVQMSVPSNLKMSVSAAVWRAVEGDAGDGAERERCRTEASRGVAGYRSGWAGGWRGSAAVGAQRAPGLAVVEGVSGCGCLELDLQEARPAEQPKDGGGGARGGAVDRAPELR